MPSSLSAGKSSFSSILRCSAKKLSVWSWMQFSCSSGVIPSGTGFGSSAATCCWRPATRIMKNSSRLVSEMETKRTLSKRGCRGSLACARTRSLKPSQESSRFTYNEGSERFTLCSVAAILTLSLGVACVQGFIGHGEDRAFPYPTADNRKTSPTEVLEDRRERGDSRGHDASPLRCQTFLPRQHRGRFRGDLPCELSKNLHG